LIRLNNALSAALARARQEGAFSDAARLTALLRDLTRNDSDCAGVVRWLGVAVGEFDAFRRLQSSGQCMATRKALAAQLASQGISDEMGVAVMDILCAAAWGVGIVHRVVGKWFCRADLMGVEVAYETYTFRADRTYTYENHMRDEEKNGMFSVEDNHIILDGAVPLAFLFEGEMLRIKRAFWFDFIRIEDEK
jgi:hypothetical protein